MGRRTSKVSRDLSKLPKSSRPSKQQKIIDETVSWYQAEKLAGNQLPSKAALHRYLRNEHNINISLTTLKSYIEG